MATYTWRAEWSAIAARIEGLLRAGEFYYLSIQKSSDGASSAVKRVLMPESADVYACLTTYAETYRRALPAQASGSLEQFLEKHRDVFSTISRADDGCAVRDRLVALASIKSQIEYFLAGIQDQIRATADRAFLHLQRCIVADSRYAEQWLAAFEAGEPACEKLGAVHLLWHGIWAFKVHGASARTDLVMGDIVDNPSVLEEAQQTAVGMVLTEWKKSAGTRSDVEKEYEGAITQVRQYTGGVAGGVELLDTRYVVVVTRDLVSLASKEIEGYTYRFINIATNPVTPSRALRR